MPSPAGIAFGEFRLDVASECVLRDGKPVALMPKAYALLRYFLAHADRLLGKDELLDAVWPDTAVSDAVLKVCVRELRKALDDDPAAPRYVATVHRRGYRFIAPVVAARESGAPAAAWAIDAARPGTGHGAAHVVGRAAALAELDRALAAALGGTRQLVFVTGEPGIGKTTVVDTFLDGVDATVLRARGQCLEQYGAGEAYLPVLDAFSRLCRNPEHAEALALLRRFAPTWVSAMPWLATEAPTTPSTSRARMLLELAEALEALTDRTPLVLVLEDLHWSDYSTLDLLSLIARRPESARLLVIGTYRPVELVVHEHPLRRVKNDLELRGHCRELPLEFLTEAEIQRYLRLRLGTDRFPGDLARLVHARTDGNPLFMVHVIDLLLDRELLTQSDGAWAIMPELDRALLPDTLRQMIAQQIAALPAEAQRVLEAASVAGVEHTTAAIAAALGASLDAVEGTLVDLARGQQLVVARGADVWPDGTRTGRFGFIHAMYQSTLYRNLAPSRRVELHQRIGDRIAGAFAAQSAEVAAELALHFTEAGDVPRALVYRRQAADRARGRHAYHEAIDHLDQALALLERRDADATRAREELALRMALGPALMAVHGFAAPAAEHCYARARSLCREVGMTPELAPTLRGLAVFYLTRGELVAARELAEESLAIAESGGVPALLSKADVAVGMTLYYFGELDAAARHLERARRAFARQRPQRAAGTVQAPIVNCLAFAAIVAWFRGRPDTALTRAAEARGAADRLAHPHSVLWAAHTRALLHHFRHEPREASAAADVAIRVASDLSFRQWMAWGRFFRGWLATLDGPAEHGIAEMVAGIDEYRATGAELGVVYLTATLAEACGRAGQVERARALLDEALTTATARSERYYVAELHRLRAAHLGHEPIAAEAELRRAVRVANGQGARGLELRAATDLAELLSGRGRNEDAHQVLAPVHARFTEGLDTYDVRRAAAALTALGAASTSRRRRAAVTPARRRRR